MVSAYITSTAYLLTLFWRGKEFKFTFCLTYQAHRGLHPSKNISAYLVAGCRLLNMDEYGGLEAHNVQSVSVFEIRLVVVSSRGFRRDYGSIQ